MRITEILLENQIDAVGCIVFAIDSNRFLVSLRSSSKHLDSPGTWSTWGGAVDSGESHENALKRELYEETRYNGSISEYVKWGRNIHKNINYQAYVVVVPKEFNPTLNWENSKYRWLNIKDISKLKPKHPGFRKLLKNDFNVLEEVLKKYKIKVQKPGVLSTVASWAGINNDKTGVEDPIRLKIIEMARKIAPKGLSMNILDKEKRAKAQGYSDQVWFHGSKSETIFTEWIIDPEKTPTSHGGYNDNLYGPGIYFAKKREVSEAYAKSVKALEEFNGKDLITFDQLMQKVAQKQPGIKMSAGQLMKIAANRKELSGLSSYALHVRMFRIRVRKPFNCMKKFKPTEAEIELIKKYDYPVPNGRLTGADVYSLWFKHKGGKPNFHNKARINDLLHKMGYDSIFHIGAQDSEVMIVFDVGAIRDVDACFDPARIGDNNSIA